MTRIRFIKLWEGINALQIDFKYEHDDVNVQNLCLNICWPFGENFDVIRKFKMETF